MAISEGRKKQYWLTAFVMAWVVGVVTLPSMPYLHQVVLCLPSYLCVTFGSKMFLQIGYKMYNLPQVEPESDLVKQDCDRANKFMKEKGIIE